jgi:hypothetical protein
MAGSGVLFVVISLFVKDPYWFLVTGSVFVAIGLILFLVKVIG